MHQHHDHDHHHVPANYNRAFAVGVSLNVAYILLEATAGLWVGSLALLADAGHNLSDVLGLLLAWGGSYLATRPPSQRYTYGFRSTSILAALMNGLILLVAVGGILWEAIRRFSDPQVLSGTTVMWVAGAGVLINGITTLLFVKGRRSDVNIRGAFLHMAADTAVSLGVVLAGLMILYTRQPWIDPAVSIAVALVILIGTWDLLRDAVSLALHAVPRGIDPEEVAAYLSGLPGVVDVHDLHIWPMSTTETALTAHLLKPEVGNDDDLLKEAQHQLQERFGIAHVTIQVERSSDPAFCHQSAAGSL